MPRYYGTPEGDRWLGSAAGERADGYDGHDRLLGLEGDDQLLGQAGDDRLVGGEGDDVLEGGAGGDVLVGGRGTDYASFVHAAEGVTIDFQEDVFTGEAEGDRFFMIERFRLTDHDDVYVGLRRSDWVAGYGGDDALDGLTGDDTLNGGDGDDVLRGGRGEDKLIGEAGDDAMTGGAQADQFWFTGQGFGHDTVTDFENGVDLLRVTGFAGADDFGDLTVSANGAGWAVITFPDGSSITLTGVASGEVDATDFLWI